MNKLFIFFENKKVGILERDQELIYSFSYSEEWIKDEDHFPLSLTLPITDQKYGNKLTLSYFENLLPEGDVKDSIEKSQHLHGEYDFLAQYGKDCAGAIIITPDENFKYVQGVARTEIIDLSKIYKAIEEKRSVAEVIAETTPGYLSLAGAQDKFPVIFKDNNFLMPIDGSPTTHIVKVPIWRNGVKDSVYNEYFCMELARAVGLKVPRCFIVDGEHPLYVIERYDRKIDKKKVVHRLHQQDFCQAQGVTSEFKYEAKGGPTLKNNYDLIIEKVAATKKIEAMETYLNWIAFNLIIGNNDSHSKNISLLLKDKKIELAPIYDLICTAIYPKLKREFSFKIGDRDVFSKIGKNQFEMLEDQLDLKRNMMLEVLQVMNEKIFSKKDLLVTNLSDEHKDIAIFKRISDLIKDRSKSLKMQNALK